MPRPIRIDVENTYYHVTNKGAGHRNIFNESHNYLTFLAQLEELAYYHHISCLGYAFDSTQFELLLFVPEKNLSAFMKDLSSRYAQYFNHTRKSDGPIFKGRFKSVCIQEPDYLLKVHHYIVLNNQSEFNNSGTLFLHKKNPPQWIDTTHILKHFPSKESYTQFINAGIDTQTDQFFTQKKRKPIYGSPELIQQIKQNMQDNGEDTHAINRQFKPDISQLITLLADAFSVTVPNLTTVHKGPIKNEINIIRGAAMTLCRDIGKYPLKEIAQAFGNIHFSTVSINITQFRKLMQQNSTFQDHFFQVRDTLKKNLNT